MSRRLRARWFLEGGGFILPILPLLPPVSLAKLLRTYPNMQLDPKWLADLERSDIEGKQ